MLLVHFANVPNLDAVPGLIAALRRPRSSSLWHAVILDGLKLATKQDLGADPEAWDAWWKSKK